MEHSEPPHELRVTVPASTYLAIHDLAGHYFFTRHQPIGIWHHGKSIVEVLITIVVRPGVYYISEFV
jgi:hypothetical protein